MEVKYSMTERKSLVNAIGEFTGNKAVYLKIPTYAYRIGSFVVSREGNLVPNDTGEKGTVDALSSFFAERGFTAEPDQDEKEYNANEKPVDNEKYVFRCFLLRLGSIDSEYKRERRILLSRLSGSSAFKSRKTKTKENALCQ